MTEPKTETTKDQQFTADMVTEDMLCFYDNHAKSAVCLRGHDPSNRRKRAALAAAFNASPLWAEYKKLRIEKEEFLAEKENLWARIERLEEDISNYEKSFC